MAWTLCTSGAAIRKAGANANATIVASSAALIDWSEQAEAELCTESRYDWITNYDSVKSSFKQILALATSSHIAMNIINYDMGGYISRTEAQTMLDVLRDQYESALGFLKNKEYQEKM